jgi:hypothetical protein
MMRFFTGTLHRFRPPDRAPAGRQTIDQVISAVWRAYSEGRIDKHEAHRLDAAPADADRDAVRAPQRARAVLKGVV